ncbi:cAMP-specific 3',5'-cyclic phosphodiesterase 7B [Trichonephila inaurata madagascariensis]|uniref:Phosphodiesterase n=1 Tax=Trichonephila inaurata madagascariensis TaxID=2747483 RepID=A0A8X7C0E8_9ARAC|nr:cAMP-specific 3',5'-cyclic phosphodiesterase 7B [Trichonephila inaurata madagascariensis]
MEHRTRMGIVQIFNPIRVLSVQDKSGHLFERTRPSLNAYEELPSLLCKFQQEFVVIENHRFKPFGEDEESSSNLSTSEICMLEGKQYRFFEQYTVKYYRKYSKLVTLLSKSSSWAFNTFNLDVSTGGRPLSYLLVHLFQEYGFVEYFKLDIVKVWHCFNLMEAAYHRHNPYHNSVHAADVTQAMHCFLQETKFASNLTPLEAMASVIAAVAHDLDHPGVTQAFLVATSNHLVNLYHNSSVLENHHWRTAISCLSESGIFNHLEKDTWQDIQRQIRSLILATDITRQKEFLARFKNYLSSESLDMEDTQYRHFALQIALKCADLCNPCRPWAISQRWSYQVCQEFYRQGAYERQLRLPVTPTFDCSRTKVAKIQADFFQFVVSPLFETWDHFLKTPLSHELLENLQHNFTQWQQKIVVQQASEAEKIESEIPQIKIDSTSISSEAQPLSEKDSDDRMQLLSADSDIVLKQHRSKSDSGLTPGLLSPKIHMETYSTEELHPSTTLLSLSSITNTVQLRQVYAATKVESHLICPTVFQPLCTNMVTKEANSSEVSCPTTQTCDEVCSNNEEGKNDDNDNAQCCVNVSCSNGCGTPTTPEKSPTLHIHRTKQRSQSLINDSDDLKHCAQVLQNRRASDFDFYLYNNVCAAPNSISSNSNKESLYELQHSFETRLSSITNDSETSSKSPSIGSKNKRTNSLTSSNICSNKECSRTTCVCRSDSDKKIPSWCWHISRSFSAERPIRPTHDFDSPLPSGHSSSSLNYTGHGRRRGSAPVTYSVGTEVGVSHVSSIGNIDSKGDLTSGSETNYAAGRRWSIPMEISDMKVPISPSNVSENNCPTILSTRRSSFGLLEPLLAVSALETENSRRQTHSPLLKPVHHSCRIFSCHEQKDQFEHRDKKTVTSSYSFLPFTSSPPQTSVQRRGSLPADLYNSGEKKEFSETKSSFLFDHGRMHGSPGDLLSVLIGPSGMLNTMHDIVSGQTISERSCTAAQNSSRRRSGGLEMCVLSGLWRSRTNDMAMSVGMESKLNLRRQLLEAWTSWRVEQGKINPNVGTTSTISALGPQFVYQQRRNSVPLNVSLLSVNSENTLGGEQVS